MDLAAWDEQYRRKAGSAAEHDSAPNSLLVAAARDSPPGRALDLACGKGRNALWLAEHGWSVTAIDGSPSAIELVGRRASARGLSVTTQVADLEKGEYAI